MKKDAHKQNLWFGKLIKKTAHKQNLWFGKLINNNLISEIVQYLKNVVQYPRVLFKRKKSSEK